MTLVEENLLGLALKPPLMLWFAFVCFSSETDVFQSLFPLEVLPPAPAQFAVLPVLVFPCRGCSFEEFCGRALYKQSGLRFAQL